MDFPAAWLDDMERLLKGEYGAFRAAMDAELKTLEEHLLILEHSERELQESQAFRVAGSPQQHKQLPPAEQQVSLALESMPPL